MTDELKAPERIWAWQEFAQGFPQGAGGWITHQTGGRTEYIRADRIAALEAALADMTRQRDAAMAGAVKVKPLVWSQVNAYGSKDVWDAIGGGHVYRIIKRADGTYWLTDPSCESPYHKTMIACQDAANSLHELRASFMWQPDPDRMLALTAAAYEDAAAVIEDNMRHAKELGREIWAIPDLRTRIPANAALSRIEAQAEARGMRICAEIYYTRCCDDDDGDDVYREMMASADETEAAAKGWV